MDTRKHGVMPILWMSLALFAALTAYTRLALLHIVGMAQALTVSGVMTGCFAGAMLAGWQAARPSGKALWFTGAALALSVLARAAALDFQSADYVSFLSQWIVYFREHGVAALSENVGDYNLLYQYALLLIAKGPLFDLYGIKLLSIVFDYALAVVMMRAAGRLAGEKALLPVLALVPLLPTVLVDSAIWGQCDSVYAFLVVLSLWQLEEDHPWRAAAALGVAFAFKLQTVFFFPVVLLGLLQKRYKLKHALMFALAYLVTCIPALLCGRSLVSALSVYGSQAMGQYYHRLTYNAPNLYMFFPMLEFSTVQEYTWLRFIPGIDALATNAFLTEDLFPTLQRVALIAAAILVLLAVGYWLLHHREIDRGMTLCLALFFAIFLPFVLPKMHDRYFFLADMLSLLYAAQREDRRLVPLLVMGASLGSYMSFLTRQRPADERVLALMMLAALVIVAKDLISGMRRNRTTLSEEGGAA